MTRGAPIQQAVVGVQSWEASDNSAQNPDISSPDDKLNRLIITLLQRDGRTAYSEIAQKLDVSEGTIRNRVTGMKEAGMLRIVAIADPVVSEYKTDAMLGLKVASGHAPAEVAERLSKLSDVVYILWVSGRFDLLVEVVSNDREGFLDFLNNDIHAQNDIAACETMAGIKNFKNQFLLKRDWEERDA